MSTRFLVVAALFLCVPWSLSAATPSERLERAIHSKDWKKGLQVCERLPEDEARNPSRYQLAASYYAKLSAQCAAVASGAGDRWLSNWWWSTAVAMDAEVARSLLPELQSRLLLSDLLPPRSRAYSSSSDSLGGNGKVRLPTGEIVDGTQVRPLKPYKIPKYLHDRDFKKTQVVVEVVVDTDGRPWQPMLLDAKALPVHGFLAFNFFRAGRFSPAVVNGAPVAAAYMLTVTMERS